MRRLASTWTHSSKPEARQLPLHLCDLVIRKHAEEGAACREKWICEPPLKEPSELGPINKAAIKKKCPQFRQVHRKIVHHIFVNDMPFKGLKLLGESLLLTAPLKQSAQNEVYKLEEQFSHC